MKKRRDWSEPTRQLYIRTVIFVAIVVFAVPALGQRRPSRKKQTLPEPKQLSFVTKDSLILKCRYYPGTKGKETVPIILLHGVEGPRGDGAGTDWEGLSLKLQSEGHAVIAPDLRGFGGSTIRKRHEADDQAIDHQRLKSRDIADMVRYDLETVKKHLMQEHNAGNVNIELLCVVGADLGAVVALNWIAQDWSWPELPSLKQGQDVKAYVLISPLQSYKGMPTRRALAMEPVRRQLSAMVIYGRQDRKAVSAGKRIYKTLKNSHPPTPKDQEEKMRSQDLFLVELDTSLQGTKLLSNKDLGVANAISEFIELRLVNKAADYPWVSRAR